MAINPYEAVISASRTLESLLEQRFGASGKGLHERVTSVEQQLPPSLLKKIRYIATVRNRLVHQAGYQLQDPDAFLRASVEAIQQLQALAPSVTQISSGATPTAHIVGSFVTQANTGQSSLGAAWQRVLEDADGRHVFSSRDRSVGGNSESGHGSLRGHGFTVMWLLMAAAVAGSAMAKTARDPALSLALLATALMCGGIAWWRLKVRGELRNPFRFANLLLIAAMLPIVNLKLLLVWPALLIGFRVPSVWRFLS